MNNSLKNNFSKYLETINSLENLHQISDFEEVYSHLYGRLNDDIFRIAVVGEFSSGKSTFINAILGKDILKHATSETTSVLTRIINVDENDTRIRTGKVIFSDGSFEILKNFDNIEAYTTVQKMHNNILKEIDAVELYVPILNANINRKIMIVDTPGLNGMADGHREKTICMVQQSHACIYLFQRGGIKDSDINFIKYLTKLQKNFIFVQNFIDDLKQYEGETLTEKLAEEKKVLNEKIFSSRDKFTYSLCGISSLLELVSVDSSIKSLYYDDNKVLTKEDRVLLHKKSRFEEFRKIMKTTFSDEKLDEIQYGNTAFAIFEWTKSLLKQIEYQGQQIEEVFNASKNHDVIAKLDNLKENIISKKEKQKTYLNNFVDSKSGEILNKSREVLKECIKKIEENIKSEVNRCKNLDAFDDISNQMSNILKQHLVTTIDRTNNYYKMQIQLFYQMLLERIEEYSSINIAPLDDLDNLNFVQPINNNNAIFEKEKDQIDKSKDKLKKNKDDEVNLERDNIQNQF